MPTALETLLQKIFKDYLTDNFLTHFYILVKHFLTASSIFLNFFSKKILPEW